MVTNTVTEDLGNFHVDKINWQSCRTEKQNIEVHALLLCYTKSIASCSNTHLGNTDV